MPKARHWSGAGFSEVLTSTIPTEIDGLMPLVTAESGDSGVWWQQNLAYGLLPKATMSHRQELQLEPRWYEAQCRAHFTRRREILLMEPLKEALKNTAVLARGETQTIAICKSIWNPDQEENDSCKIQRETSCNALLWPQTQLYFVPFVLPADVNFSISLSY